MSHIGGFPRELYQVMYPAPGGSVLAERVRSRQTARRASRGRDAMLSIPTPDHYLPLLYVIATRQAGDPISFPVEGIDGGSVSMLAVKLE